MIQHYITNVVILCLVQAEIAKGKERTFLYSINTSRMKKIAWKIGCHVCLTNKPIIGN